MDDYDIHMTIEREVNKANLRRIQNKKYMENNFPHIQEYIENIKKYCVKADSCNCCPLLDTFCLNIARNVSYYTDI